MYSIEKQDGMESIIAHTVTNKVHVVNVQQKLGLRKRLLTFSCEWKTR